MRLTLAALSALDRATFTGVLGGVFERSPWIAERAWSARPFGSTDALHAAMLNALVEAGADAVAALLRAHPELATRAKLTGFSAGEQAGAGLDTLEAQAADAFASLNSQYVARFGFPFIIAVRGQRDVAAIEAALRRRLGNAPDAERETALQEVATIARLRLEDLIMPGDERLTIHVLDTSAGRPAVGLHLALSRDGITLSEHVSNADGRCDTPLLTGSAFAPGLYEIAFDVASWRAGQADPGFYDVITVRFRIGPGCGHVHIPLLLSPYGYSTYRGS